MTGGSMSTVAILTALWYMTFTGAILFTSGLVLELDADAWIPRFAGISVIAGLIIFIAVSPWT